MSRVQSYDLVANSDTKEELLAILKEMANRLTKVPGNAAVEILIDTETSNQITFLEFWDSDAAQKEGGAVLNKAILSKLMATLAQPPKVRRFSQP